MKKKIKKKVSELDYELGVICRVCDSVTFYDDNCGCHICLICERREQFKNEQNKNNDKDTTTN